MTGDIAPGELWIVAPPEMPDQLREAVGYLIFAGVDIAFGPGDTLPAEPPENLDGIRMILVCRDDVDRVRAKLTGFRGFHANGADFYTKSREGYVMFAADEERLRKWFAMTFLHENDKTWLAVYGSEALASANRLESPLLLTGELTLKSPRMREKMLARSDEDIREPMMEAVRASTRYDWCDISCNMGKAMLDDYEATGDRASLDAVVAFTDVMLENQPVAWYGRHLHSLTTLRRLHDITGNEKYCEVSREALADVTDWLQFKEPARGWCHASYAMAPETAEVIGQRTGDMGSFGELMSSTYLPVMASAKLIDREEELADLIARCVKEQRRNLRDPETGLYWHGIPARRAGHEGFMGHGHGWSTFGLSQILDFFPEGHPERGELLDIHREQVEAAARVQDGDGGFHTMLNWPWTHFNLHYTSWFGYAFLRGARLGWLDASYRDRGLAAWEALKYRTFWGNVAGGRGGNPVSRQLTFYVQNNCRSGMEVFKERGKAGQAVFTLLEVLRLKKR